MRGSVMNLNFDNIKLGEVLDITSSKRVKRADYVTEGIPFFRSKEIIDLHKGNDISTELFISVDQFNQIQKKFGAPVEGDILLTSVGTLGVPYRVQRGDNFYFKDGNLTWFRQFSDRVNSKYLYYWLTSSNAKKKIDDISIGSTQKALTIVALKSLEMALPSIDYQNIVVGILDSISNKIINNRKVNQTLETIAQTLFKSWFVDFDPVKAKLSVLAAGGSAEEAERSAMCAISARDEASLNTLQTEQPEAYAELARTAALFPSAMQDSELGEIPVGWEVSAIENVIKRLKVKKRYKKKDVTEYGSIPVYEQGAGILLGYHDGQPELQASTEQPMFIFGDHTCVTKLSAEPFSISENVIPLEGKKYNTYWVYYAIQGKQVFQEYRRHWMEFIIKKLVLPSLELAENFSHYTSEIIKSSEQIRKENSNLTQIRDTLLPKLLSGELTLPDKTPSKTNPPENAMLKKQPLTMGVA